MTDHRDEHEAYAITPLPAGISNDEYIRRLRRQCDMEAAHIAELKEQVRTIALERDAAREKIARIVDGMEGCCMACEPVGVRNQQLEGMLEVMREQVEHYVSERDEARREVCILIAKHSSDPIPDEKYFVCATRGWDCFREEARGNKTRRT